MRSTVLITGCSAGGAGNAIAKTYNSKGLHVFATARRLAAMENLQGIPGITLVQLDVTDIASIKSARDQVASVLGEGKGLDLLVNNAGVVTVGAAVDMDLQTTRNMFDANVFGMMAMVQEFMPLLMLSNDACIVNTGSVAGLVPFAFSSSYNATKAAVHSYSDTLRLGMHFCSWIKVTTIWLGGVKTNMSQQKPVPFPETSYYAPIEALVRKGRAAPDSTLSIHHPSLTFPLSYNAPDIMPAEVFANSLVTASLKNNPSRRLTLGTGGSMMTWISRLMPDFMMVRPSSTTQFVLLSSHVQTDRIIWSTSFWALAN
ncbi:hypothetical protein M408DRAFT_62377 [Serendipita vermifera MAFF 305830]|uniref:NAD(P)-binding protein n=1 Tax=Serendipita vermifera MAFF 305830 TaxID=933852 RepID=A0A0C2XUM6_SERVB|nr:hypothetical protein M408DRAFT_62377 [Serendipita vermifera MAFF 305830]